MTASLPSILVVDDNDNYRALLSLFLSEYACVVRQARDGEEAVELYAQSDYALVIMDVIMPLMDGVDAIAAIRNMERKKMTKCAIIVLSAEDSDDTWQDCRTAGADRMLIKPVEKMSLLGTVEEMLGG